ncbi:hypothetical protein PT974_10562 [Cladobotryum mycophilum]|uniref:Uncharacterized protein n=1 Tax=Cladobotryum mycophilum TaxID=491253 RepID=A0ABR0SA72_9HYPO
MADYAIAFFCLQTQKASGIGVELTLFKLSYNHFFVTILTSPKQNILTMKASLITVCFAGLASAAVRFSVIRRDYNVASETTLSVSDDSFDAHLQNANKEGVRTQENWDWKSDTAHVHFNAAKSPILTYDRAGLSTTYRIHVVDCNSSLVKREAMAKREADFFAMYCYYGGEAGDIISGP